MTKDQKLAQAIIKRLSRERLAQPGKTWGPKWKAVWEASIVDEIQRHRKESRSNASERALALYEAYPRKVAKERALIAISKALKLKSYEHLMERTEAYAKAVSKWSLDYRYSDKGRDLVPHPASWFNGGCYDDDPREWVGDKKYNHTPRADAEKVPVPSDWVGLFMRKFERADWEPLKGRVKRLSDNKEFSFRQLPPDLQEELRGMGQ